MRSFHTIRIHGQVKPAFLFLLGALLIAGCVTNKQVLFLQHNKLDVDAKKFPADSLLRTYDVADKQYRVQPEDMLSVRIESLTPQEFDIYSRSVGGGQSGQSGSAVGGSTLLLGDLIDHHGDIPFILTGKVNVAGLTIYEIQDKIQKIADEYLKSPIVRIRLLNYRVTVLGEVNREGLITINYNRVSVLEAIGLAGGLGELADRANIKLIRQYNNKAEVYYVNLLSEELYKSPLFYTQQGDILIVRPLKQRTFRKYFSQNFTLVISVLTLALVVFTYTKK